MYFLFLVTGKHITNCFCPISFTKKPSLKIALSTMLITATMELTVLPAWVRRQPSIASKNAPRIWTVRSLHTTINRPAISRVESTPEVQTLIIFLAWRAADTKMISAIEWCTTTKKMNLRLLLAIIRSQNLRLIATVYVLRTILNISQLDVCRPISKPGFFPTYQLQSGQEFQSMDTKTLYRGNPKITNKSFPGFKYIYFESF